MDIASVLPPAVGEGAMLATLAACVAGLSLLYYVARFYGAFRHERAPPLISGRIPFVGCWYDMWKDPLEFLQTARKKHGDVFSLNMGHAEMTWCFDATTFRNIFKAPESRLSMLKGILSRGIMVPLIGEKLPTSMKEVHQHLTSRIEMIKLFKRKFAPRAREMSGEYAKVLRHYFKEINAGDTGVIDMRAMVNTLSVRCAIMTVCGPELHLDKKFCEVVRQLKRHIDIHMPYLFDEAEGTIFLKWIFLHLRYRSMHEIIRTKLSPFIKARVQWKREDPENWLENRNLHDLLAVLINYQPTPKTKAEEQDLERLCLMTCSNALFGTLANLPSTIEGTLAYILTQEKILGDAEADVAECYRTADENASDLPMPFIDACFNEYVRMWPVISISRYVEKDFELSNGYIAKKGTCVQNYSVINICPRLLMRDPEVFIDPDTFSPYRIYDPETGAMSPEVKQAQLNMQYMPFGRGSHKCAGMSMSFCEMKICIGLLLRDYKLEALDPFPGAMYICTNVAQLKGAMKVKFTRRQTPLGSQTTP